MVLCVSVCAQPLVCGVLQLPDLPFNHWTRHLDKSDCSSTMGKGTVYIFPLMVYFFVFFFSIVYLSSKFQKKCTDVGLRFFCLENRYRNGSYFHDREEKMNYERCAAKYSQIEINVTLESPSVLYYCIFFLFVTFFLFLGTWYCSIYHIKTTNLWVIR